MLHAVAAVTANIKLHLPSNPAHAKNYNANKKCDIAIYCLNCRFRIRRGRYLLEVQDKNREFSPTAAFTNKDAVFSLIFEMLSDPFSVDIALKNLRSEELIIGKHIHGGLKTINRSEILTETIDRYLKVIESEASISNFHFSYVHVILSFLLSIFSCGCIFNYIFSFWKENRIVPYAWSS
jgi:ferredoxin